MKYYILYFDHLEVNKSFLITKEECICPGLNYLTLECTLAASQGGTTVWSGTGFDCPSSTNEILLFHTRFNTSNGTSGTCNNGSIVVRSLQADSEDTYISQLKIRIKSWTSIPAQIIACQYDEGTRNYLKLMKKGI